MLRATLLITVALCLAWPDVASAELKRLRPASNRGFEPVDGIGPLPTEVRIAQLLSRFDDRSQRLRALPERHRGVARASSTQVFRGRRYAPQHVIDRNPRTAWVEHEEGPGVGTWLEIEVDPTESSRLFGVLLAIGFARHPTMYRNNPRPKESLLTLRCGEDGALVLNYVLEVDDTRRPQLFVLGPNDRIESPGRCRVRLTTLAVYAGERFEDLSLTELRLVVSEPRRAK